MRKTIKIMIEVKNMLDDLKYQLKLKNLSEVILYLIKFYELKYENIRLLEHESLVEVVKNTRKQKD